MERLLWAGGYRGRLMQKVAFIWFLRVGLASWILATKDVSMCESLKSLYITLYVKRVRITLYGKRCDEVKDFERRSLPWIIKVGPTQSNYKYPHKNETEEDLTDKRERGSVTTEAEIDMDINQKNVDSHRSWRRVPGRLQKDWSPADPLILDFCPPELWQSKFLLF